jgi:hypothetical protein
LVNFLRDNPMTQFSIRWILSLNRLSQKWGQVQFDTIDAHLWVGSGLDTS